MLMGKYSPSRASTVADLIKTRIGNEAPTDEQTLLITEDIVEDKDLEKEEALKNELEE